MELEEQVVNLEAQRYKTYIYSLVDQRTKQIRYIGKSDNPYDRLHKHLSDKRKNHRTCWLKSMKEVGLKPEIHILATVNKEEWKEWEIYFINYYTDLGCDLVNGTIGGDGVVATEEVRKKISNALSKKQVLQYSLNGDLIDIFKNCVEASNASSVSRAAVQAVCNKRKQTKSAGGFIWKNHIKGNEMKNKINAYHREKPGKNAIKVKQLSMDNSEINIFDSISEASRKTNIDRSSIQLCIHDKTKQANGFIWKTIDK